jgi:hypothetical protein
MVIVMDRAYLCVMCSGVVLLVTAFALATPSVKSAHPPAEQAMLVRLLQYPASSR